MTDKKPKPPRPPAPNLPKKRTLPSTTISLRYNPLMGSDDDDDFNDSGISFITTKGKLQTGAQFAKSASLDGASNLNKFDPKSKSQDLKDSFKPDFGKHHDNSARVTKPVARAKEQVAQTLPASTVETEKKKESMPVDSADGKSGKPNTTITGVMKVPNTVLKEDTAPPILPFDSEEALTDPLSFLDKVMEEQLEKQFLEEETELERKKRDRNSASKPNLTSDKRARSLDDQTYRPKDESTSDMSDALDIDPCYYTVPAPSELPDEAVIQRPASLGSPHVRHRKTPAKNMSLSLSGLLATSNDNEEEEEAEKSASTQSSRSTLDSPDEKKQEPPPDCELQSPSEPTAKVELTEATSEIPSHLSSKKEPKKPDSPPVFFLSLLSLILFVYFQFPLSRYMSGFFVGMLMMFYLMLFCIWLSIPSPSHRHKEEEYMYLSDEEDINTALVIPGESQSASVIRYKEQRRVMQKPSHADDDLTKPQGWMNELPMEYDADTYHTSQTQSVYVRLDGYSLRLSRPRQNIPRRAMFDEPAVHKVEFVYQRHYDMRDSKVYLLPSGLVKKRLWSKKYPICIELPKKGISIEKKRPPNEDVDAKSLGFDFIHKEECDDRILYLFTRTSRDKEEWYWKFDTAAKYDKLEHGRRPIPTLNKEVFLIGSELIGENGTQHPHRADPYDMAARKGTIDFYRFMTKILPKEKETKDAIPQGVNAKVGNVTYASPARRQVKPEVNGLEAPPVEWVNAFIGRFFWDFLREESWAQVVKTKMQKKLSKLKVPYFIEELKITDIDLGVNSPQLRRVSKPRIDGRGLWVDLDMAYSGSCMVSMTTKVNLWRLSKGDKYDKEMMEIPQVKKETKEKERSASLAALDSEMEDSAESSDEEADDVFVQQETPAANLEAEAAKGSGKLMRLVNKIAGSKYFQSATQNKYIKRAMDEVSNTPVELSVEIKQLRGALCVNVPPPPTDRIWYGFRKKPYLWLSAKPKLGARQVTITHITDYIEKKLELEFQKVFVLPNMDDVPIPIMTSSVFDNSPFQGSSSTG